MNMISINAESLTKQMGEAIPDLYVIIAKNSVVGLDATQIAELLSCAPSEVIEAMEDSTYKAVRMICATEYSRGQLDSDFTWDALEQTALANLSKQMQRQADPELNLKVAVMANKAQRRFGANASKVLDPGNGVARVPLSLTHRIVKRLNSTTGEQEVEETRSISLNDGSAVNPTFDDIDKVFGVSVRPHIAEKLATRTRSVEMDIDALAEAFINDETTL
jgi:hypothetical protein